MNKKHLLILSLCTVLQTSPVLFSNAQAQDDAGSLPESQTYDPTHSGMTTAGDMMRADQESRLASKGFVAPTQIRVSIVHLDYMDDDQFGIMMIVPDMASGCETYSPLEYEAKFVDPYFLDIKVKKYRKIAPPAPTANKPCDRSTKVVSATMVLDRKDIQSRGTQEIRFSGEAGQDTYKLSFDGDRMELIPESQTMFKGSDLQGDLKDRLIYDFSNSKTIALQVPMAQPGEDLTDEIMEFASSHALKPVENRINVVLSETGTATYYFQDNDGRFGAMIGPDGYGDMGSITVMRPMDGPDGRTQTPVELRVFVTRPGTQL